MNTEVRHVDESKPVEAREAAAPKRTVDPSALIARSPLRTNVASLEHDVADRHDPHREIAARARSQAL